MLFSVEYNKDGIVEIYCDREGVDLLIQRLKGLREHGDHEHFMTPSWAGDELTEEKQNKENELVHHLHVIFLAH